MDLAITLFAYDISSLELYKLETRRAEEHTSESYKNVKLYQLHKIIKLPGGKEIYTTP